MAGSFLFLVVLVVVLSLSSASPTNDQRRNKEEVVDFSMDIIEGRIGYTEKIEVDLGKQTELFQVPTHPGVDRSDVLHDFKSNLTMLRFPESKVCYLFPLVKRQSTPEKLMKDLKTTQEMVVTETRRLYSRWVLDEEVTDPSSLGEESNEYCAQYTIYHVTEKREQVTAEQTEGGTLPNRVRRQSGSALNGTKLCRGGMDLDRALQVCSEPKMKCVSTNMCFQIKKCREEKRRVRRSSWGIFGPIGRYGGYHGWLGGYRLRYVPPASRKQQKKVKRPRPRCWNEHDTRKVIKCCKYVCDKVDRPTTSISPTTETMEIENEPTTPISPTTETVENEDEPTTPISPTTETVENEDEPTTPISPTTETVENEDEPTTPISTTTETVENEEFAVLLGRF